MVCLIQSLFVFQILYFLAPFINAILILDNADEYAPFVEDLFSDNEYRRDQSLANPSAIFDQTGARIQSDSNNMSVTLSKEKDQNWIASGEVGSQSLINTDKRLKLMRKHRQKFQKENRYSVNLSQNLSRELPQVEATPADADKSLEAQTLKKEK